MDEPTSIEALWRLWQRIEVGEEIAPEDDLSAADTIRRLLALDRVPEPDRARMQSVRNRLAGTAARLRRREGPTPVATAVAPASQNPVRVLIADGSALFRRGMRWSIEDHPDFLVVGEAGDGSAALQQAEALDPDVAFIDLQLPKVGGLEVTRAIKRRHPQIAVIVLSPRGDDEAFFRALQAGASVFCEKDALDQDDVPRLAQRAARGEYVINEQLLDKPSVAARVIEQFRSTTPSELAPTSVFAPLTDRELVILKRVSDGLTNAEIGYALGISAQTVKNHVTSILRKMAVNDRTAAVVAALKRGWISIDDTDAGDGGAQSAAMANRP